MSSEPTARAFHFLQSNFDLSAEMLDYLPNALGVLGLDGSIRAVNRAALKLLNFHTSEVIGRHFSYFLRSSDPPLLEGGFPKLLELGSAHFNVALRCGGNHFVQVEIQLIATYDEKAQPSGVLVMSGEGDGQNILLRRAVAKVADQVSHIIAYSPSDEVLWSKLFALCRELFETPGGWLTLRGTHGKRSIPFAFGPLQGEFNKQRNGVTIRNCPCTEMDCGTEGPYAVNRLDCPWLAPDPDAVNPHHQFRHHAVAPIISTTGEHIGDICLIAPAGRIFHRHELLLMDAITDQISQALERGEIHFPAHLDSLDNLLSNADNIPPEFEAIFEQILKNLATVVPFASAGVFLQEAEGLRLMAAINHPQFNDLRGQLFPFSDNQLHQEIVKNRALIIVDDVRQEPRFHLWGGLDYIRGWMGLPLVVSNTVIGVITIDSTRVGGFSPQDGGIAQAFADQAAIAVEKALLADELRREKRNLELLYQLSQSLVAIVDPVAVADKALTLITQTFNDCFGEIYVMESDQEPLQLLTTKNHPPHVIEKLPDQPYLYYGVGLVGAAVQMHRPILVPDIDEDPRWLEVPNLDLVVGSVAAIPLIARNETVGALVLGSAEVNVFNHSHLSLLQSIAMPIALALQNARLFTAERQRRQEAEILHKAAGAITLDLRLEQILHILLERLRQVVEFDSACVMLLEGKNLQALAEVGLPQPDEVLGQRFPVDNSFFAEVQRAQQALFFDDVQTLPRFSGWGGTSTTRSWMGVPLIHRGEMLGYITLDSLRVGSYSSRQATLAQSFANQMAITIVNAHLLQESQQAAFEQQEITTILRRLNSASSLADIHAAVAPGLHRIIGPSAVEIALYQSDEQRVSAQRSYWSNHNSTSSTAAVAYGFEESAAIHSLLKGQSHISPDVRDENQWPVEGAWAEQGYRSQMSLPLQGSERVLGHIGLFWRDELTPAQAIHFALRQISDGVTMAAERIHLLQQATNKADELQILTRLSAKLRITEGRAPIIQTFLTTCLDVMYADRGYVLVPIPDEEVLEMIAQAGTGPLATSARLGYTNSIAGRVFRSGVPYCSSNLLTDPLGYTPHLQSWAQDGITFISALYAPLRAGDQIIGVLTLTRSGIKRPFSQTDLNLLNAIAEIAGNALHRATIWEGLEQQVERRTADLARANAQLLELDQMKSDFVSNVGHELRTPLTNIKLYLDLLNNGRTERRPHYLHVIQREVDQLRMLVESILDLSALDENRATISANFESVLMNDIVEMIADQFRQQAAASGLQFNYSPPSQALTVWGHRERILQLGVNLTRNAISYTKPGGRVALALEKNEQDEVGIVVQDSGIGIDPDEIAHIFERFYRGKRVKQSTILGTGLGLSIVSEIAQAHNGRIEVKSVPDEGTTFTVWFPTTESSSGHQPLDIV